MRALSKPSDIFLDTLHLCFDGVGPADLRIRYAEIEGQLVADSINYNENAISSTLWTIPANTQTNEQIVVGRVTKDELKKLYSSYLAGQDKPGRVVYDRIMASAPGERCPYCGIGRVSTLDHFLPKASFPKYSVLSLNLVPACRDCNMGYKGVSVASSADSQPIHPYYDAASFNGSQWLFGEVQETRPASVRFFARPPDSWPEIAKRRTHSHLAAFDLAQRFAVEAADEISSLRQLFLDFYPYESPDVLQEHLLAREAAERVLHQNSWKRALFQALAVSEWYCSGGYR